MRRPILRRFLPLAAGFAASAGSALQAQAPAPPSVFVEELTWTEVRDALQAGVNTVIIPTGGTEQNGPHMILGKHNFIIKHASGEIASRLGNALVAPVIAYVPEGSIDPPSGHMRSPGTISLPAEHFAAVVEYAARSFRTHGFVDIVLIGDSGGNARPLRSVADKLNQEWAGTPARVHLASEWRPAEPFNEWLVAQGETMEDIGSHGGILDTSLLLAVHPEGVRMEKAAEASPENGVSGDPTRAKAEYGRKGLEIFIDRAVRQIRELRSASRTAPSGQ